MSEERLYYYLIQLVGMCKFPKDHWDNEDRRILKEASDLCGEFLLRKAKELESSGKRTSTTVSGDLGKEPQGERAEGKVPKDTDSLQEGVKDTGLIGGRS